MDLSFKRVRIVLFFYGTGTSRCAGDPRLMTVGMVGVQQASWNGAVQIRSVKHIPAPSKGSPMEAPTLLRDLHWTPLEGPGI